MVLVIDNYDSFTYNLVQYLGELGAEVVVHRNDQIELAGIAALAPAGIMLSPGPCRPTEAGVCLDVLAQALAPDPGPLAGVPIFGVCLGQQSMAHVAGGIVRRADRIMQGKTSMVRHDEKGLFEGVPSPFRAVRYHSLVADRETLPPGFFITATAEDDDEIMGIRHRERPIEGLQFHPESVLTEHGHTIVSNFLGAVGRAGGVPESRHGA